MAIDETKDNVEETKKPKENKTVVVPEALLLEMQKQMADTERKVADMEAKNSGLEELLNQGSMKDDGGLKKKKNFEPKFHTVRIRKYPIAGDVANLGYVIGWTDRGAYEEVDATGVNRQVVNFIDIYFLGVLKPEKVRLLDLMNKGVQEFCKIVEMKKEIRQVPTKEEIDVTVFDP